MVELVINCFLHYHAHMCAEAEDARVFFRGTQYQYELNKAADDRDHHALKWATWIVRLIKWRELKDALLRRPAS